MIEFPSQMTRYWMSLSYKALLLRCRNGSGKIVLLIQELRVMPEPGQEAAAFPWSLLALADSSSFTSGVLFATRCAVCWVLCLEVRLSV